MSASDSVKSLQKRRGARRRAEPASLKERVRPAPPTSGRGAVTYEKLMLAAGELLGEVGFERLTTNAICARAKLTPPALYRYFDDKYEILAELGRRLLKRQYEAYAIWLFEGGVKSDPDDQIENLARWFAIAARIVEEEPGAVWTLRAMRALPNMSEVRLESQRLFTNQMFEYYKRILPDVDPELLWHRLRIRAEFGFVVDEMAIEQTEIPRDVLFREAARILSRSLSDAR